MSAPLNLARKADRLRFMADLCGAIEARCPAAMIEEREIGPDDLRMRAHVPGLLSVSVSWLRTDGQSGLRIPLAAWHGAARRLCGVQGAWQSWDINPFHGRKATGIYGTLPELIDAVVIGLNAAADGSAFVYVAEACDGKCTWQPTGGRVGGCVVYECERCGAEEERDRT